MNLDALETLVNELNVAREILERPQLSLFRPGDRAAIARAIEGRLSPERLTMDGELSPAQWQAEEAFLIRCAEELESIDPDIKINDGGIWG